MYLTLSKRFELCTSIRLWHSGWSQVENETYYGPGTGSPHGHGYNYVLYVIFHGPVDPVTGMMINFTDIKKKVGAVLTARYDHKYLNADSPPFDDLAPTPENIARQILSELTPLFAGDTAQLIACHLEVTPYTASTAYADGRVERHFAIQFSSARSTRSPYVSEQENIRMFGAAASRYGHGHNYTLRATIEGPVDPNGLIISHTRSRAALEGLRSMLDHKNLNVEVPDLTGHPMTTECLTRSAFELLKRDLPLTRVRLNETDQFFAVYSKRGVHIGFNSAFHAAHRLHSADLSDGDNESIFGKCNNPSGHGHRYRVEATIGGLFDERSGTLFDLPRFASGLEDAIEPWKYKHLDLDTGDFENRPSTGENIVTSLWPRLADKVDGRLLRLRLWETPNNRFTLRDNL